MNISTRSVFCLLLAGLFFLSCNQDELPADPDQPDLTPPAGTSPLPAYAQRDGGDAAAGWDYLRYGDYIGSGIPYDIYTSFLGGDEENVLDRQGDNANIPPNFNAFDAANGVRVVGGITCFGCHAARINGAFVPGLGNSFSDYTSDNTALFSILDNFVLSTYGENSPEWEAYEPFGRGGKATAPHTLLPFKGINPAFMIEQAAVAHRDPTDLSWQSSTVYPIPESVIGSDVPPLWNVKKKNALYYNGMGRGDHTKLLMQVMTVAVTDSAQTRQIYQNFDDVLAWMYSIEPPAFPGTIDQTKAAQGQVIFEKECAKCHGTYGVEATYPNLLVDVATVQTDPAYADYFIEHIDFTNWFNQSWFADTPLEAEALPSRGYMAPPLDGIWATAPYLHNGSVPTLAELLDSSRRPTFWQRTFENNDYDLLKVGWHYTLEESAANKSTYDTTIEGYGNQGHYFGDSLPEEDRNALLEYLKML